MSYGGERGAIVIVAPKALVNQDIEISPSGSDGERTSSAVQRRVRRNRPPQYTAEYASLAPGSYTVWRAVGGTMPLVTVRVVAGKVTEVTLTSSLEVLQPEM